jgi:predicted DNA-binding protein (UPF0251 family)
MLKIVLSIRSELSGRFGFMPRPCRRRWIGCMPHAKVFGPRPNPSGGEAVVTLGLDEFEAIRLADAQGLSQEQAAEEMNVSRPTFGRILESARRKVAQALVHAKTVVIEGGPVEMVSKRKFLCYTCHHTWEVPFGTARPSVCPKCQSNLVHRHPSDRGPKGPLGGRGRHGRGRCRGGGPLVWLGPADTSEAPPSPSPPGEESSSAT